MVAKPFVETHCSVTKLRENPKLLGPRAVFSVPLVWSDLTISGKEQVVNKWNLPERLRFDNVVLSIMFNSNSVNELIRVTLSNVDEPLLSETSLVLERP